jgi:hypothetical protein
MLLPRCWQGDKRTPHARCTRPSRVTADKKRHPAADRTGAAARTRIIV